MDNWNKIVNTIVAILGVILMGFATYLSQDKSKEWVERIYWAIFVILGFIVCKWGLSEYRLNKQEKIKDKESADKHLPT